MKMNLYACNFVGKRKGGIGGKGNFSTSVKAETKEQANLKLHDDFDHVEGLQIALIPEE